MFSSIGEMVFNKNYHRKKLCWTRFACKLLFRILKPTFFTGNRPRKKIRLKVAAFVVIALSVIFILQAHKRTHRRRGLLTEIGLRSAGGNLTDLLISNVVYDPRFPNRVRFIGLGKVFPPRIFFCHFHRENMTTTAATYAGTDPILEQFIILYDGFSITCKCPSWVSQKKTPVFLSLSESSSVAGKTLFPLQRIPASPPKKPTIVACTCPLFSKTSPDHLVAWIEANRLLGVQHFVFYDYNISEELIKPLTYYTSKGIATVIGWKTHPIPSSSFGKWPPLVTKLHYNGQFSAFNDCLYRFANRYRYTMFIDLDELIVPRKYTNLTTYLPSIDKPDVAEFRFLNTYVRKSYPKVASLRKMAPDLANGKIPFLEWNRHENRVLNSSVGTKVVVKFGNALVMGVHSLVRTTDTVIVTHDVPATDGLLYHYRDPPRNLYITDRGIVSQSLVALQRPLISAIRKIKAKLV